MLREPIRARGTELFGSTGRVLLLLLLRLWWSLQRTPVLPVRRLLLMVPKVVLFVCVENACRSLMAEAMFNARAPAGWRADSAGTRPASGPNSRTASMLREIGLDMPEHPPRLMGEVSARNATVRITMGCLDDQSCPMVLKQLPSTDWGLPDPSTMDDVGFRRIRDELFRRVSALVDEIGMAPDR